MKALRTYTLLILATTAFLLALPVQWPTPFLSLLRSVAVLALLVATARVLVHIPTRRGHAPGVLPKLWKWSFVLPIPSSTRAEIAAFTGNTYIVGVLAVLRSADRKSFALARHTYPIHGTAEYWGLPGGAVNHEPLSSALKRELSQELSLEISVDRLLLLDAIEPPYFDLYYECSMLSDTPRPSSEVAELKYFSPDEFPHDLSTRHRRALQFIIANYGDGEQWPLTLPPNLLLDTPPQTRYTEPYLEKEFSERFRPAYEEPFEARLAQRLQEALTAYVSDVQNLGIIREIIVGEQEHEPVQVFNVMDRDFSPQAGEDERYRQLARSATRLENSFDSYIPLFVSLVNPSQLQGFLDECARRNILLMRLPLNHPELTATA